MGAAGIIRGFVGEVVLALLAVGLSFVGGWLIYATYAGLRRIVTHANAVEFVAAPDNSLWKVRRTWRPWPADFPVTRFALKVRDTPDELQMQLPNEHRVIRSSSRSELTGCALPVIIVALLGIVAVFLVELLFAGVAIGLFGAIRHARGRGWRVSVESHVSDVTFDALSRAGSERLLRDIVQGIGTAGSAGVDDIDPSTYS